jgi:hypothetical protein
MTAPRQPGERACEHCGKPLTCNAELQERVEGYNAMLDETLTRAESAEAALAQAQRERDEFQRKYHEAMDVLTTWGNIDSAHATARMISAERSLAQAQDCKAEPCNACIACLKHACDLMDRHVSEQNAALAQARAALESTREALFSYRSLAYGYAPIKTLKEYDDEHERVLLPPPGDAQ